MTKSMASKLKAMVEAKSAATPPARERARRDSFSLLDSEQEILQSLRRRALHLRGHTNKSEIVRAAIRALAALDDTALEEALGRLPRVRSGRPPRDEP